MTIAALYNIYLKFPQIQTDSRNVKKDDLFFALKGPNFNGNLFAQKALQDGAAYAIVDEPQPAQENIIFVEDVLKTLQLLAKHHREQFDIPFIAITGSNGKTTTKELIHAVLSTHLKTYTTEGNLNNHIGIPLTILKIKKDAQIAVIEMGANHLKEIEGYCLYAQPTHGIITNCGKAHLEGFGSELGVRKGKGELYDYLRERNKIVFAFDDYAYLHEMAAALRYVIWYGTKDGVVTGHPGHSNPFLVVEMEKGYTEKKLTTHLIGAYNLPNVLCAVAVGRHFEVPDKKSKTAIENYAPSNSRSQLLKSGTNDIILDAYNANPSSMKVAIENMVALPSKNKVLVLGAMKELGVYSHLEHTKLLEIIDQHPWKAVLLIGKEFESIKKAYPWFLTAQEARGWFEQQDFHQSTILIKGSRGIALEKILATSTDPV